MRARARLAIRIAASLLAALCFGCGGRTARVASPESTAPQSSRANADQSSAQVRYRPNGLIEISVEGDQLDVRYRARFARPFPPQGARDQHICARLEPAIATLSASSRALCQRTAAEYDLHYRVSPDGVIPSGDAHDRANPSALLITGGSFVPQLYLGSKNDLGSERTAAGIAIDGPLEIRIRLPQGWTLRSTLSRETPSRETPSREALSQEASSRETLSRETLSREPLSGDTVAREIVLRAPTHRAAHVQGIVMGALTETVFDATATSPPATSQSATSQSATGQPIDEEHVGKGNDSREAIRVIVLSANPAAPTSVEMADWRDVLTSLVRSTHALLGPRWRTAGEADAELLVAIHPRATGSARTWPGIAWLDTSRPPSFGMSAERWQLAESLVATWFGDLSRIASSRTPGRGSLRHGLARYLALQIAIHSASVSERDAVDALMLEYARYRREVRSHPSTEYRTGGAGFAAAFCADTLLRTNQNNLANIVREFRATPLQSSFAAALERTAPHVAAQMETLLHAAPLPVDLGPCLSRIGYRLEAWRVPRFDRTTIESALSVLSMRDDPPIVGAPRASRRLQTGDRIVRADDTLINSIAALQLALGRADTTRVHLAVERDGRMHKLSIRRPKVESAAGVGVWWHAAPADSSVEHQTQHELRWMPTEPSPHP